MKNRPLTIRIVSLLFILSPLGIIGELIFLYAIPLPMWYLVFNPGIWNWQVVSLTIITPLLGLAVWTVHRWAYWTLVGFSGLVLINNIVLWIFGRSLSSQAWQRVLFVLLILAFVLLILRKDFAAPYFNPRMRWWEQARRYCPGAFKVIFRRFGSDEQLFEATLFDISETGIYVVGQPMAKIGDMFGVDIELSGGRILHASAEVVRVAVAGDPVSQGDQDKAGFGCRFSSVERNFSSEVRKTLKEMRAAIRKR